MKRKMEGVKGIAPSSSAWKAAANTQTGIGIAVIAADQALDLRHEFIPLRRDLFFGREARRQDQHRSFRSAIANAVEHLLRQKGILVEARASELPAFQADGMTEIVVPPKPGVSARIPQRQQP